MLYRAFLSRVILVALSFLGLVCLAPSPAVAQRTNAARHLLDVNQPDLRFTDVTLSDALDYVRDTAGVNLVVDWKSLEAANIDRNTLINLHLHNVSLRKALTMLLNEAGAGNLLTFYVQDNIVQITTSAKADTILYTMVYPVGDLLVQVPNFQVSDVSGAAGSLSSGSSSTTIGGSSTSAGGGLGGGSSGSSNFSSSSGNTANTQTTAQMGADLVALIKNTIRPEIWKDNGGIASIVFFHNSLIVTAPISVQEAIGGPVD
jgi:hypothetical protein